MSGRFLLLLAPSNLTLSTTSSSFPPTITGSKCWFFGKGDSQLFTLISVKVDSVIMRPLDDPPFGMNSDAVVLSTNFQRCGELISRSLIIETNSQRPNLVPCGTLDGTEPHSEKQPSVNLILCDRPDRKSETQLTTLRGISNRDNPMVGCCGFDLFYGAVISGFLILKLLYLKLQFRNLRLLFQFCLWLCHLSRETTSCFT